MKLPRDIDSDRLIKVLESYGYKKIRQKGSHIRIQNDTGKIHRITIPKHNPIKVGTLSNILSDVSDFLKINKKDLIEKL